MASMVRASSPPEAARARGWSGSPAVGPEQEGHLVGRPGSGDVRRRSGPRAWPGGRRRRLDLCGQRGVRPAGGPRPPLLRARLDWPGRAADLGLEFGGAPFARRADGVQAPRRGLGEGDHLGQVVAVLALELAEQLPPGADRGQTLRVVLPGLHHRPQLGDQVGELGHRPPAAATRRAPTAAPDRPGHRTPRPAGRGRWLLRPKCGEDATAAACRCGERGRGQPLLLRLQTPVLVDVLDGGLLDLGELVARRSASRARSRASPPSASALVGQPAQLAAGRFERAAIDAAEASSA